MRRSIVLFTTMAPNNLLVAMGSLLAAVIGSAERKARSLGLASPSRRP